MKIDITVSSLLDFETIILSVIMPLPVHDSDNWNEKLRERYLNRQNNI